MAEEATARKEEETPNLDFEDMTDLRDDAISDFEMSFDREAELREENERRVAEQANLSHSQDHYMANKGAYDAVGATASAGIQEDEEPPSSSRSILKKFLKSTSHQSSRHSRRNSKGRVNRRTNSIKTDRRHHTRRRRGRETVQDKTNTKTNQQTSQKGKSPKEVKGGKIKNERRCSARHRRSNGHFGNTNSRKEETLKRETVQSKERDRNQNRQRRRRENFRKTHPQHQTAQSKKSKRKATPTTSIRSNNQHPQRQQDTQCRWSRNSTGRNRGVIFIKSTSQETNNEQGNITKQGRNTSDKREVWRDEQQQKHRHRRLSKVSASLWSVEIKQRRGKETTSKGSEGTLQVNHLSKIEIKIINKIIHCNFINYPLSFLVIENDRLGFYLQDTSVFNNDIHFVRHQSSISSVVSCV